MPYPDRELEGNKPLGDLPIRKITFSQWLKHPTTALLILVSFALWGFAAFWVKDKTKENTYLKSRISTLELREAEYIKENNNYIRALLFKDYQIKEQSTIIQDLKTKKE